jgi:hypothetical protein
VKHKSLNQLLCAATVNVRFRDMLLRDPARAIDTGYFDHRFSLTPEEKEMVLGIEARQLEDFAAQIYSWMTGNGNGYNGHSNSNGNGHGRNGHSEPCTENMVDLYRAPTMAHA